MKTYLKIYFYPNLKLIRTNISTPYKNPFNRLGIVTAKEKTLSSFAVGEKNQI